MLWQPCSEKNSAFCTLSSNFNFLLSHQYRICLTGSRSRFHYKQPLVQAEQAEDTIRPTHFPLLLVKIAEMDLFIYLFISKSTEMRMWIITEYPRWDQHNESLSPVNRKFYFSLLHQEKELYLHSGKRKVYFYLHYTCKKEKSKQ